MEVDRGSLPVVAATLLVLACAGCGGSGGAGESDAETEHEIPPPMSCEDVPLTSDEVADRFDDLIGATILVEGTMSSDLCICWEDWPCTPPDCGYVCGSPANVVFKASSMYLYVMGEGWECECDYGAPCISCTPFDCGEPVRILAVPEIWTGLRKVLVVQEVCP